MSLIDSRRLGVPICGTPFLRRSGAILRASTVASEVSVDPLQTKLCDKFGIEYPIAAFTHCKDVAAAVTGAGGIGVLGMAGASPDEIAAGVKWLRDRVGDKPFGIDVLIPASVPPSVNREDLEAAIPEEHLAFVQKLKDQHEVPDPAEPIGVGGGGGMMSQEGARRQLDALVDLKVPIIASGLGNPAFVLEAAHANGISVWGLVGKVRQARREIESGVDVVIAQGHDAGGHNSPIGTFSLVPQVVRIAGETPILCAGGVTTGEQVVAALALGAAGVWTGSIWLASHESDEHMMVKEKVLAATEDDTILSRALTGKRARLVKNAWTMAWEEPGAPKPLAMPLQGMLGGDLLRGAREAGIGEFAGTGLGQGVGVITEMKSCRQIITELVFEAQDVIEARFGEGNPLE